MKTMVPQRVQGIKDQKMLEEPQRSVNNLMSRHVRDLEPLEEQKKMKDGWEDPEARVQVAFLRYARGGLDSLDS